MIINDILKLSNTSFGNLPTGGVIGSASTTVDKFTVIKVAQTTANQTLSIANPTNISFSDVVYIVNTGTASFTLLGKLVEPNKMADCLWSGAAWVANVSEQGNLRYGTTVPTVLPTDKENDTYIRNSTGAFGGTFISEWSFDGSNWIQTSGDEEVIDVTGVTFPITFPITTLPGTPVFNPNIPANSAYTYQITDGTNVAYAKWNGTQYISTNIAAIPKPVIITSSGTYTPSANMKYCIIEMVGGGGGGGGAPATAAANQASVGQGGAAGGYLKFMATKLQIGTSQPITIGAAGTGNLGAGGGTGGTTSFGALANCTGGTGGVVVGPSTSAAAIGSAIGGIPTLSIGTLIHSTNGGRGGGSNAFLNATSNAVNTGVGGSNPIGIGGVAVGSAAAAVGVSINGNSPAPSNYGGGGSGTANAGAVIAAKTGSPGLSGVVIIMEYF